MPALPVARTPVIEGTFYGALLIALYSFVIAVSTPYLPALTALQLALERNGLFFVLLPSTFGLMMGLRRWNANKPQCSTRRSEALGTSSSILSTFFSFFSLTLVGCCGLLAFWVSTLLGTAVVLSLVELSVPLSFLAFAGMVLAILVMVRSGLRTRRSGRRLEASV